MSEEAAGAPPKRERQLGIFEDKILAIPNMISLARLACVPCSCGSCWEDLQTRPGWGSHRRHRLGRRLVARKFDVISEFGKFVDPLTDRVALIVPIFAIAIEGVVPWWLVIVTLAREGLVALAGLALGAMGGRRIDVTWWGKVATFGRRRALPARWCERPQRPQGSRSLVGSSSCRRSSTATCQQPSTSRSPGRLREGRLDKQMAEQFAATIGACVR